MSTIIEENLAKVINYLENFGSEQIAALHIEEGIAEEDLKKRGIFLRDFGMNHWDWPQGVGIFGLKRDDEKNNEYISNWAKAELAKGLPTKNINTMCPLLTLADFPEFDELCLEWMTFLETAMPLTKEDGFQHITSGDDKFTVTENYQQIWADTVFMTVLFVAKMGKKYNRRDWQELAIYQFLLHAKYLAHAKTGLFNHGWYFSKDSNFGENHWCRGNSWITMAIPLLFEILGEEAFAPSTYKHLLHYYTNQLDALVKYQDHTGLWHTLIEDETTYLETSGSAGIVAGFLFGLNQGLISKEQYGQAVELGMSGLLSQIDEAGCVAGVSAGTPISQEAEDYKHIVQMPMVYGESMMMVALKEYQKFSEEQ